MVDRRKAVKELLRIARVVSRGNSSGSSSFSCELTPTRQVYRAVRPECTGIRSGFASNGSILSRSLSAAAGKRCTSCWVSLGVRITPLVFSSSLGSVRGLASSAAAPPLPWYSRYVGYSVLLTGSAILTYLYYPHPQKGARAARPVPLPDEHTVTNWSGTHAATTRVYLQPESLEELEELVKLANEKRQRIRPVGSGLSPNGIGLSDEGMVNLALMDRVLSVDEETKRVRVQAGARVSQVVEALRPHGLTLQNYASIREQQIGGFIQVGAHGTGARIPPVDEQVLSLKLVTPGKGTLELSSESGDLFYLARCGLGALGVVAEVELQCVTAHKLLEKTIVTNMKQVKRNHKKWLQENKHLRYMWIPYTDTVVVVQCNPLPKGHAPNEMSPKYSMDERLSAAVSLYKEVAAKYMPEGDELHEQEVQGGTDPQAKSGLWGGSSAGSRDPLGHLSDDELNSLSFPELRDKLLAFDPLNKAHVTEVNQVEAEYWKKSEGIRVGWSDEILSFDCGGQQWVSEICFPTGTLSKPNMQDVKYMEQVLNLIKKLGIPAPAPIEQRWSASSQSPLSPAFSQLPDTFNTWIGIIMYLPTLDEEQREAITKRFFEYRRTTQHQLWDTYGAHEHWAKIEVPNDENSLEWVRERLQQRYPVADFQKAREELDPNNIFLNETVEKLFPPAAAVAVES